MCVLVDTNVANDAFTLSPPAATRKFFEYIDEGKLMLIIGGKRLDLEFDGCGTKFRTWLSNAIQVGRVRREDPLKVAKAEDEIKAGGSCKSEDEHLVALAKISGAELVFTNDRALQTDCQKLLEKNVKIYTTNDDRSSFDRRKRTMLEEAKCRMAE